jgi:putative heme-binding domain-containing protein
MVAFLRELLRTDGDHEALWIALADCGDEGDWSTFVTGLATPSREVREACARALGRIERDPEPIIWRGVLDCAARFGYPRGNVHLGVLAHWRGDGAGAREAGEWSAVLAGWEIWFRGRWPDFAPPAVEATPAPVWSEAQILAFLTRSSARPGSPVLGARVFAKATCSTCHVAASWNPGPAPNGWGPDLAGVTKRFDTPGLLDTIVNPSSFISDQYRTQVVITTDEERLDGRLVSDDVDGVTLLLTDGEQRTIPHDEIESRRVSELSTMPEGLLAGLTLEQIKDLFAYLAGEGVAPSAEPGWVDFLSATGMHAGAAGPSWSLRNGVLVGRSDGSAENDYLCSETACADFEVELDVFLAPGGNSGLLYRSRRDPAAVDPVGLQLDLGQRQWGSLFAGDGRGTLVDADPRVADVLDRGGWNHVFARVRGDRHTFEINGLTTVDARDAAHAEGLFAFQLHAGQAMEVRIANARLKVLD